METELIIRLWTDLGLPGQIIAVLLVLHPIASIITTLTPTPKDDKWPGLLYNKVIRPLALNIGKARSK